MKRHETRRIRLRELPRPTRILSVAMKITNAALHTNSDNWFRRRGIEVLKNGDNPRIIDRALKRVPQLHDSWIDELKKISPKKRRERFNYQEKMFQNMMNDILTKI